MPSNHFSRHEFPLHLSFMDDKLQQQLTYLFYFNLTYQGFTSLYHLLLFPYSNCQDCFLLRDVLHMQVLELARLGTSPLSTTGENKATCYDEWEDFHAVSNFNISCSSNADHRLFFPNYCFGWAIWFLELVEEHQKSTISKQGYWEHNTG